MSAPANPYEYDFEPVRGLPEALPEGEEILWQGAPDWAGFAVHALHVRLVTAYFAVLAAAQPLFAAAAAPGDKTALARAAGDAFWTAALGLVAVGLLSAFACCAAHWRGDRQVRQSAVRDCRRRGPAPPSGRGRRHRHHLKARRQGELSDAVAACAAMANVATATHAARASRWRSGGSHFGAGAAPRHRGA